ncbi:MAG: DUF5808 domain-containing protein [Salinivirgaceae bacterium]|jgi:hypothetical protein|nr:DUF5808 domain-containing protein [Salinivirgaceae bacterium]
MEIKEKDKLWNDRNNWKPYGYYCKNDARIIVPKKDKSLGFTFNFAHKISWFLVLLIVLIPMIAIGSIAVFGISSRIFQYVLIFSGFAIIVFILLIIGKKQKNQ